MNFAPDSFRIRIAILFGGLTFVVGLIMMAWVNQSTTYRLVDARGAALGSVAKAISNAMTATLTEREREIYLLSQRPIFADKDLPAMRQAIDLAQRTCRNYAWIGFADTTGIVRATGGGVLEGMSVA